MRVRRNISLTEEQESRLLAAMEADDGGNLSFWLVHLGLDRANELEIPRKLPPPKKRRRKPKTGTVAD